MHDVLEEVDGDIVTLREVCPHIHGEELVDLPLGPELGAEGSCGDRRSVLVSGLHTAKFFTNQL